MTNAIHEWVVYEPPKSTGFGHQSKLRNPRKAWPVVAEFLASCAELEFGHRAALICYSTNPETECAVSKARIEEARQLFGTENGPISQHPSWPVSESKLEPFVQFALDNDRFPKQKTGPSRLYFFYRFRWAELEKVPYWPTKDEKRDGRSALGVTIENSGIFLQPRFVFPAPWNSDFLKTFISRIEPILPFRFRDQYFQRSIPSKSGTRDRRLKLPKNWRQPEPDWLAVIK